ncbi:hypothetical protein [Clostridium autoethanogenum]|uniref:Uncharacterized protein n=1 Tax=Clostridium autoethanogenum DSM 10061 TaxID=1341692 RepID=A0ABM5NZW5_9CLOT|nr:hypothetical protein [Clostridium autoethanogenum]AGY78148.1 hypothetical protein CAETHG_3947 [Clostridium autoethanogenum DSM 10061]ALU38281.1 Hypothetical protein CLAU_3854 [Clostridium autoethanogenum DSM 10061]OVY51044.1 hypothetical protein WX72_02206 [Clostridium autoethanogenum]
MIDEAIKEYYYNIYKKFYLNAGVMSCFIKSLVFTSVVNLENLDIENNVQLDMTKIKSVGSGESLIILDIPGGRGLEYGYKYRDKYTIVPDFNMVCHDFGVVKSNSILKKLALFSNTRLKNYDKYMIILDSNRYVDVEINNVNQYNNQYEITEEDLPEAEMFNFLKIHSVLYVCDKNIKEDAKEYLNYLKANNIGVNVSKLKEKRN